ncbi:uncharacterized protein LOC113370294 [Ctenocephalides felis]|uniref:uncharacterized protein LOC113370294 n=1 Tax=Ctenocephalides felis TaxID=7515 RepID=UPI000E6E43AF|nr:uncharacterized protein LOC113370294 [Ctenocephalides felis]
MSDKKIRKHIATVSDRHFYRRLNWEMQKLRSESVLQNSECEKDNIDLPSTSACTIDNIETATNASIVDDFGGPSSYQAELQGDVERNDYSSLSDSEDDDITEVFDARQFLAEWAVNYQIPHNAVSALLKGLKLHDCFSDLPADSRTLLKTKRTAVSKVVSPEMQSPARTDEHFRSLEDEDYHNGYTRLLEIPYIGLVTNVPLDYMHLICLGAVKRLMLLWTEGELPIRLPYAKTNDISNFLCSLKIYIPKEFARKPRSLKYVRSWKATEFRQLLLYSGPVVLKSHISNDFYKNFLTLHVAIKILCSNTLLIDLLDYAEQLLHYFVESFKVLYGDHNVSHNIHNILHLANDARSFGTLDSFSAFKFENYMQVLKKYIRKSEKPLQQIYKRYFEVKEHFIGKDVRPVAMSRVCEKSMHFEGPLIEYCGNPQYKVVYCSDFTFNINEKSDSFCALRNGKIVNIINVAFCTKLNQLVIIGKEFKVKEDLYDHPCKSSLIGEYMLSETSDLLTWPITEIIHKYVVFPLCTDIGKYAGIPME